MFPVMANASQKTWNIKHDFIFVHMVDTCFLQNTKQNNILLSGLSAELHTEVNLKISIKKITMYKKYTFQMICIPNSADYKKNR